MATLVEKVDACAAEVQTPRAQEEEDSTMAELAAQIQEECFYALEAPIFRLTGWDIPYPHAHEWAYFPTRDRFARAMKTVTEA